MKETPNTKEKITFCLSGYDSSRGNDSRRDLAHDLILPTILFVSLGAMTWAVRGCSGFGAMKGCIFAGVMWGTAWWFIARDPSGQQSRRYTSGWIILALTIGIGISGARGWMQWPSFFEGHLQTNAAKGEFVPIGLGWSLFQNWKWAHEIWPDASFNWWRCWESSGGISIGVAYGLAYFLVNRKRSAAQIALPVKAYPNLERLGAYAGLVIGLGLSIKNGLKGWANIYVGNEQYWENFLWHIIGPLMLLCLVLLAAWIRLRPIPKGFQGDVFPHAYRLIWIVLIIQNVLAQLVTGPLSAWNEMVFSIYYVLLFLLSGVIVFHFQFMNPSRP